MVARLRIGTSSRCHAHPTREASALCATRQCEDGRLNTPCSCETSSVQPWHQEKESRGNFATNRHQRFQDLTMTVDVLALVALIFQAGSDVIGQCRIVQQCAGEAARIALRTQNVLGLLQVGEEELLSNVPFECSLLYLRERLEAISVLLGRCKQPARLSAKAFRAFRMKATQGCAR